MTDINISLVSDINISLVSKHVDNTTELLGIILPG